jgi:hypothetical protein
VFPSEVNTSIFKSRVNKLDLLTLLS